MPFYFPCVAWLYLLPKLLQILKQSIKWFDSPFFSDTSLLEALCLPAPIWTGCSVGLQHNCHPGTSLHYSSGLDPIFPGPYIFLFVSLLLCSGLCSCSPPSIPLLPHCINSCAIWVELTPLPALGIELYDINQSE